MQFFELVKNTKKRTSHKDLSNTCGLSLTHLCCVYALYVIKVKKSTLFQKKVCDVAKKLHFAFFPMISIHNLIKV